MSPMDVPPLNHLYFYLTEGCNLACRHCWLAPKYDPAGSRYPVLPVELFETAIKEAKPLGLAGVKLTGGEPLLHPDVMRLLKLCRQAELGLIVETNGMACTPAVAAEIAKSKTRFVSVSIDGADAATHEWVRGVRGSFEKARRAVKNLVAAGIRTQIIMSLMRCNADQVNAVVKLAKLLGAASVKFNIIQPTGRGAGIQDGTEGLPVDELIRIGRFIDRELAQDTEMILHFDYPLAFTDLNRIHQRDSCGVCGIMGVLGVMADGHYALCGIGKHIPELVFGMAGKDSLNDVWRSNAVLMKLRAGLPARMEGVCARCLMKGMCLGACVAQNYFRKKRFWAPFWFCEAAEREGLFPETRLRARTS